MSIVYGENFAVVDALLGGGKGRASRLSVCATGPKGWRTSPMPKREVVNRPPERDQVERAKVWLADNVVHSARPAKDSSYCYKHFIERDVGGYISNGALIAAAADLGFHMQPVDEGDINTIFYMQPSEASSKKLETLGCSQRHQRSRVPQPAPV